MDTDDDDNTALATPTPSSSSDTIAMIRWGIQEQHYFNLPNTKVVCTTFHPPSDLLAVGFSTGVFGLWEMPRFTNIITYAQYLTGKSLLGGDLTIQRMARIRSTEARAAPRLGVAIRIIRSETTRALF